MLRTLWAGERLVLNAHVPPLQPMFPPPHRMPIYIAGYQGRFIDLCGEKADGYLGRPAESVPAYRLMRARAVRVAQEHGRSPDAIEFRGYVLALVGDTRRDALNRAKREPFVIYMMSVLSNVSLKRAGFPPELRDEISAAWRAEDYHRAGLLIPDELLDAFLACGTREEVARRRWSITRPGMDVPFIQPILQDEDQVEKVLEAGVIYATDGRRSRVAPRAAVRPGRQCRSALNRPSFGPASSLGRRGWRRLEAWYEVTRPFSLTATIIPVSGRGGCCLGKRTLHALALPPGIDRWNRSAGGNERHQRDL